MTLNYLIVNSWPYIKDKRNNQVTQSSGCVPFLELNGKRITYFNEICVCDVWKKKLMPSGSFQLESGALGWHDFVDICTPKIVAFSR